MTVLLFHTTTAVMHAERLLKKGSIPLKLIPTPRDVSSDCGISIRIADSDLERAKIICRDGAVEISGIVGQ